MDMYQNYKPEFVFNVFISNIDLPDCLLVGCVIAINNVEKTLSVPKECEK